MALKFSNIESVQFGDFAVAPQMDKEQKLRVSDLTINQDDFSEAIDLLSRCFGSENTEKVRAFMEKHMFYLDLVRLQTYLTQGESGLTSLDERMDKFMEKEMEKRIEEKKDE